MRISVVVILLSAMITSAFGAAVLSVQPVSSVVGPGSNFTLFVKISGVTDLYDYQFDITYVPSVISAGSITEDGFLSSGGATFFIPGTIDSVNGVIANTADALQTAISGVSG